MSRKHVYFYASYYYKIHQMHDSDIFPLKIGIPDKNNLFATLPGGGGFFRTPSNFTAFGDPLKVKYMEMFHADFSYLFIY